MSQNGVDIKVALNKLVDAWETLPGGYRSPTDVESWLAQHMAPAINRARRVLGRKIPQ